MNQTRENGHENCANFTSFGSNQDPQSFFRKFYLYQMLNIVASYHCRQFEGKLMIQTREKGEKPHFRPNLGPLGPHLGCQKFFQETGFVIHQISWSAIIMHNIKKTNDQILRKVSDGRTDGRTDRQTGHTYESDFIGCSPTNVDGPRSNCNFQNFKIKKSSEYYLKEVKKIMLVVNCFVTATSVSDG